MVQQIADVQDVGIMNVCVSHYRAEHNSKVMGGIRVFSSFTNTGVTYHISIVKAFSSLAAFLENHDYHSGLTFECQMIL